MLGCGDPFGFTGGAYPLWELKLGEPARLWGQEGRTPSFPVYEALSSYDTTGLSISAPQWSHTCIEHRKSPPFFFFYQYYLWIRMADSSSCQSLKEKDFSIRLPKSPLRERNGVIIHSKPSAKFYRIRNLPRNATLFECLWLRLNDTIIWIFQVWKLDSVVAGKIDLYILYNFSSYILKSALHFLITGHIDMC